MGKERDDRQPEQSQVLDGVDPQSAINAANAPAIAEDVLPDTLVILPLPGRPFFPGQVQPVGLNPRAVVGHPRCYY